MRNSRLLPLALLVVFGLSACGALKSTKTRLPGERISVLALEKRLEPDPDIANMPVALPHPEPLANWPQAGGNAAHDVGHPALSDKLEVAWTNDVGDGSSRYGILLSSPIVVDGVVYTLDAKTLVTAWRASDGERLWENDVAPKDDDSDAWGGGLAFDGGRIFVTTGYGQVVALDAKDGKEIWRVTVGLPLRGAPTVSDGRIYAVNIENSLQVLSVTDGHKLWDYDGVPETAELAGSAGPAVDDEIAVVPFSSGEITALRVDNGREVWSDSLAATRRFDAMSTLADIRGRPVIDHGRVFALSHSGRMAAIDLKTGDRAWEQDVGSTSSPWIAGDFVYVLSTSNEVICLTRADGRVRWITQLDKWEDPDDKSGPITWTGPVLAGDRLIVVASNGQAWSLSPYTGKPLGRIDLPSGSFLPPVVADGTLYLMTSDAELIAIR